MNTQKLPPDLKSLVSSPAPTADDTQGNLCLGCEFGVGMGFSRSGRIETACEKGLYTLTERRFSGPVLSCEAFKARAQ